MLHTITSTKVYDTFRANIVRYVASQQQIMIAALRGDVYAKRLFDTFDAMPSGYATPTQIDQFNTASAEYWQIVG